MITVSIPTDVYDALVRSGFDPIAVLFTMADSSLRCGLRPAAPVKKMEKFIRDTKGRGVLWFMAPDFESLCCWANLHRRTCIETAIRELEMTRRQAEQAYELYITTLEREGL